MRKGCLFVLALSLSAVSCHRTVSVEESLLRDRIYGGWAGKLIGVQYGAPHEFWHQAHINEGRVEWDPSIIPGALNQDDIYTQLSFLRTFDSLGLDAGQDQLAQAFAQAGFELFHANLQARKNWLDGLRPPQTGSARFNAHADDIDFQIDADFIGFMCPGMPVSARRYCERIGPIMNDGDGIYGGVYMAALHSLAFFESDMERLVRGALDCIPEQSAYARCVSEVLEQYRRDSLDWRAAWSLLHERWESHVCAPGLAFNIDAKMNGAYVTIGLLYGGGDLDKTMEIAVRCGQDADCNASNAAAVWGVVHGYEAFPEHYRQALAGIADSTFAYTPYSWTGAAEKTLQFATENIRRGRGLREAREGGDLWRIRLQRPCAEKRCRVSFPGMSRAGTIPAQEWSLGGGGWTLRDGLGTGAFACCGEPGAWAEVGFEGEMVTVSGAWGPDCGRVDIYIDGELVRTIDGYMPSDSGWFILNPDVLFVASGLVPGPHTLRMVIRDDRHPDSTGHKLAFVRLDAYSSI